MIDQVYKSMLGTGQKGWGKSLICKKFSAAFSTIVTNN